LAGANRPADPSDFQKVNAGLTEELTAALAAQKNKTPVVFASSAQAELPNDYGKSKREAEAVLRAYAKKSGAPVFIYRLPNVFGKWCRPDYNSAVATFCHNTANGREIKVNDRGTVLTLVYIDDAVKEFTVCLTRKKAEYEFYRVPVSHEATLGEIADTIREFDADGAMFLPHMKNEFVKKLYATYLSYLPPSKICKDLVKHADERGSFTEILKSRVCGQTSINVSKPGLVKGNHWHNTKAEKFCVVSGTGVIRQRKVGETEILTFRVSGDKPQIVEIPPGFTHNIENTCKDDMAVVMWANELYDPNCADTFFENV
jgi:UDP-2-acetamido-2,6-beta-L-arabino-hexul-4-ose reductase